MWVGGLSCIVSAVMPSSASTPPVYTPLITPTKNTSLNSYSAHSGSRMFRFTPAQLNRIFESPISADPVWPQIVWPVIYTFQALWLLSVFYAIFRKTTTVQTKSVRTRNTDVMIGTLDWNLMENSIVGLSQ